LRGVLRSGSECMADSSVVRIPETHEGFPESRKKGMYRFTI
jgi:hypothetical protein